MTSKGDREDGRRYLVTGGAGFIGSHLTDRLLERGATVTMLDDLSTGLRENVSGEARLVLGDVTERATVRDAFDVDPPDCVLHLAAQVSGMVSHDDPWRDFRTNVEGTLNVIAEAERLGVAQIVYASSMAIYGSLGAEPVTESANPDPLSPYAVSKLAAERLLHNAARRVASPIERVTSLRMFNVYGPRQSLSNPYQGVVSVFISNLLADEPITLYGDGEQSRDFVYVDDVIDAWLRAIDLGDSAEGDRLNVGTGTSQSINRLLDAVLAEFGTRRDQYPVTEKPELPGDQREVRADTTLADRVLGWRSSVSFEDGLRHTIDWARTEWRNQTAVS